MENKTRQIELTIDGVMLNISHNQSPEYMSELATKVSERLRVIRLANPGLALNIAALIILLQMTDEQIHLDIDIKKLQKQAKGLEKELLEMRVVNENLLAQIASLMAEKDADDLDIEIETETETEKSAEKANKNNSSKSASPGSPRSNPQLTDIAGNGSNDNKLTDNSKNIGVLGRNPLETINAGRILNMRGLAGAKSKPNSKVQQEVKKYFLSNGKTDSISDRQLNFLHWVE